MDDEIGRFVRAVGNGEWWQSFPGNWSRMNVSHCRALVRPAKVEDGVTEPWVWAVKLTGGQLFAGAAASEHEAKRQAERIVEEHRSST